MDGTKVSCFWTLQTQTKRCQGENIEGRFDVMAQTCHNSRLAMSTEQKGNRLTVKTQNYPVTFTMGWTGRVDGDYSLCGGEFECWFTASALWVRNLVVYGCYPLPVRMLED